MQQDILCIRADATPSIGTGHIMRCLALAQAWQDAGGSCVFLAADLPSALEQRLNEEGMQTRQLKSAAGTLSDADETAREAIQIGAKWIVVDGYHFGSEFQAFLKNSNLKLMVLDDFGHCDHYHADFILNQNLHASEELYQCRDSTTRLLLGTRFTLLRREFRKWNNWKRDVSKEGNKILVTMGGSDPDNVTSKAIDAIRQLQISGLKAVVVIGAGNVRQSEWIKSGFIENSDIEIRTNVTDMSELMVWADVAVTGGGSTTWELASLGLPAIAVILADNQKKMAEYCQKIGIGWNLGWHAELQTPVLAKAIFQLLTDLPAREAMALKGPELIDGKGANRVAGKLHASDLQLRFVEPNDSSLIWEWANEPENRRFSFSGEMIPWNQHKIWFESKLKDPNCFFMIAMNNRKEPIGQIRFDMKGFEAVISTSIAFEFRGMGYGSELMRQGVELLLKKHPKQQINAYILKENTRSRSAVIQAGFIENGIKEIKGFQVYHFVFQKG